MPFASTMRESPMNTQHPRVSHEADATCAPRAALPVQPTIDASLDLEPATAEAHAPMPIAIATPQTPERHASDPRPEPEDSPPALTMPTSTSSDVSANSPQQPHISNHADTLSALRAPFLTLSIHAAVDLTTVVDRAGPPNDFFAGPVHLFARANTCDREPESLAPRTSPAMSVEEIDEDLLDNIIEDTQNAMRIEARCEVRVMALKEGQERGWSDGFEEGKRHAKREARVEEQQRERAWKDGYEQGRWDGYQEGLKIARTETDDHAPTLSPPACACNRTLRFDPATSPVNAAAQTDDFTPTCETAHTDTGVQAEDPPPPVASLSPPDNSQSPHLRVQASTQTDTPRSSVPAHARMVQEIKRDLLTNILAKAIAKGEAIGLTKGKHLGFQDGREAGWKLGKQEGHAEGYGGRKNTGVVEERERQRLELRAAVRFPKTACTAISSTAHSTFTTISAIHFLFRAHHHTSTSCWSSRGPTVGHHLILTVGSKIGQARGPAFGLAG
ncbi:hypothetical protein EWM64_g9837 [Hericium alpestre]|uniref:Essential protein Yae1 N-terminal domain-containing protein n=1 Tax=Hericium alpestre TaxID=135208 RepID=A0A4Y9ZHG0_9AGAM|nr:hypothetical protein EWM64_g9837 [Hericium alpestre]